MAISFTDLQASIATQEALLRELFELVGPMTRPERDQLRERASVTLKARDYGLTGPGQNEEVIESSLNKLTEFFRSLPTRG